MYSLIGGVKLKIGKLTFDKLINCKIEKSTRLLSNTAIVELPLSAVFENTRRLSVAGNIKKGDKVIIELGYDGELIKEFEGYVTDIKDKDKTVITCEDNMYKLRKQVDNKMFKKVKLKQLVEYIASGFELSGDLPDIEFEKFVIKNATALQILQKIKDNYGLMIFLDNENKLFVGLSYTYKSGKVIYNLQENIPEDGNNLSYKNKDDIKFKIKAVSLLKDNKKLEIEAGDNEGDLRTLYFYNITDEGKLKELAEQEIEKYKYTGYTGTLKTFGLPYAAFGMVAKIKDKNYPAREGSYYIEGINIEFGDNGFSRKLELGIKL